MFPTLAAAALIICGQSSRAEGDDGAASSPTNDAHPAAEVGPASSKPLTLAKWLEALARVESGNRAWIVHQDRDGRYYYGCLQFRETTFRFYVEKFDLAPVADEDDVMELIYDCSFQKSLAARMIRDNPENWKHWRTTVHRIGLPPGATGAPEPGRAGRPSQSHTAQNQTPVAVK